MLQQQSQSGGNAVSSKEVDLAYNALWQFTTVADFNYLGGGPRTDMATGAYSYDTGDRLTGLTYTSNAGANHIDAFGWAYDAANNVTSFSTDSGTATYGSDATNQLTSASYTGTNQPADEAYSFDKNGNRTMAGYSTGSDNLITSDGTFNYQHDADGNQPVRTRISSAYATDYETTFAWDYRNRLTDVEYFDNNGVLTKHVHYVYGVFDHLLATEVDTTGSGSYDTVEHYVLDVSPEIPSAGVPGTALAQPLMQFDGSGAPTIRYLEALNQIFAEGDISSLTQDDVADFMLTDNLGTVRYVVDQSGTLVDKIDYNSFGQVSFESNAAIHHFAGYTGGHIDQNTGEVNMFHRWYDPATGRWMSQDAKGFGAGDLDLSRYVGNDPAGLRDPAGLAPPQLFVPTAPPPGWQGPWGYLIQMQYAQWFAAQNFNTPPPGWQGPWGYAPQMQYVQQWANWLNQQNAARATQVPTMPTPAPSIFNQTTTVPFWQAPQPQQPLLTMPWAQPYTVQVPYFKTCSSRLRPSRVSAGRTSGGPTRDPTCGGDLGRITLLYLLWVTNNVCHTHIVSSGINNNYRRVVIRVTYTFSATTRYWHMCQSALKTSRSSARQNQPT